MKATTMTATTMNLTVEGVEEPNSDEPRPFESLLQEVKTFLTYWRTRRAVVSGDPVFDYSPSELRVKGLMDSRRFNIAQSLTSSMVALAIGKVLTFFYPIAEHPAANAGDGTLFKLYSYAAPMSESIFGLLSAGLAPFTLLLVAHIVAWGSLWKCDLTLERKTRAAKAYLYLDAAYGFYPQLLLAVATATLVGLQQNSSHNSEIGTSVLVLGGVVLLTGLIWQALLTSRVIAKKLFEVNGYSPKRRTLFNIRTRIDLLAPWQLYKTVAVSGVAAFYSSLYLVLWLLSFIIVLPVAALKLVAT